MRRRAVFTQISIVTVLCVLLLLAAYVCVCTSNCKIEAMPVTLEEEELDMMWEQYTYKIKSDCLREIRKMSMSFRLILIDEDMLSRLYVGCPRNSHPINVGVDKRDVATLNQSQYPTLKFVPFEDLETKDFLKFDTETGPRIMARFRFGFAPNNNRKAECSAYEYRTSYFRFHMISFGNVFIPHQVGMKRDPNMTVSMPPEAVRDIVWLRDLLYQFRVHPMLNGGTLLGWYRECGLIPHTTDFDLSLKHSELRETIITYFKFSTVPKMWRRLGLKNDSLELTVKYPGGTSIDIFVLYREGNTSWVGACDSELNKYKYTYPLIDEVCSANLLGHQFFVPCNAKDVIDAEYGNWTIDHLTSRFGWNTSHENVKKNGKWNANMTNEVYFQYAG